MIKALIRTTAIASLIGAGSLAMAPASFAQDAKPMASSEMPMVGGAPMDPSKTIPENASKASNLTTLVAAVKAAGLAETLGGKGPFTVFAPTNEAFAALPKGTVDMLLKPENKDQLTKILTYHVVPAAATSQAAMKMIKDDGGEHKVKTVEGEESDPFDGWRQADRHRRQGWQGYRYPG